MEMIPDTHNGPLYQAWKRMRDAELRFAAEGLTLSADFELQFFRAKRKPVKLAPVESKPILHKMNGRGSVEKYVLSRINGHPVHLQELVGDMPHNSVVNVLKKLLGRGEVERVEKGMYQRKQKQHERMTA